MNPRALPLMIDDRTLAPHDRYPVVFAAFNLLGARESVQLESGQDLQPVQARLHDEAPGQFLWDWLEQGPGTWRASLTRLMPSHGNGGCCGGCGGA